MAKQIYKLKAGAEKLHFSGKTSQGMLTKKLFSDMTQAEMQSILEYYAIGNDPTKHPYIKGVAVPKKKAVKEAPQPPKDIAQNEKD